MGEGGCLVVVGDVEDGYYLDRWFCWKSSGFNLMICFFLDFYDI